jgi:hypothetical protein
MPVPKLYRHAYCRGYVTDLFNVGKHNRRAYTPSGQLKPHGGCQCRPMPLEPSLKS